MGTDYPNGFPLDGEGPIRSVVLSPFAIDVTPVTNLQFSAFVEATSYVTEAERYDWSFVFAGLIPKARIRELVEDTALETPWWCKVRGASWKTPEGPASSIKGREEHPAVHISQHDAAAYAAWAGKQLPTEAEWEYAARGGPGAEALPLGRRTHPRRRPSLQHLARRISGPRHRGGRLRRSVPGARIPPNGFGLYSVAGNVWEWTSDWFGSRHPKNETTNPRGPKSGTGKVIKGGSFLCHASYCNRYRVAARTQNTPDSSASNIGFRCVRRLP